MPPVEYFAPHGTRMQISVPKEGWVRLIRESEDEDGRVRVWMDLRVEDLLECATRLDDSKASR